MESALENLGYFQTRLATSISVEDGHWKISVCVRNGFSSPRQRDSSDWDLLQVVSLSPSGSVLLEELWSNPPFFGGLYFPPTLNICCLGRVQWN